MKKVVIFLAFFVILLIINGCTNQNNDNFETVIFYSPHADDEVLSMGASIMQAKKANKEVIVVLLSKGLASSAFPFVNEKLAKYNLPPITLEEFGNARSAEFKKSVKQLGADHYYIYNLPDGNFLVEDTKKIINEFAEKYPKAQHHAMTYHDPHNDHAATGKALKELIDERKISNGIYHLPIQEFNNLEFDETDKVPFFERDQYKRALDSYGLWSPHEGYYSIGQSSVTSYFTMAEKELSSHWHR